nr:ArsB/NhaD family transporter [Sulfuracidifex metallicus]
MDAEVTDCNSNIRSYALLVNFKPKGIPIGYSALIGGALTLILGISNIHDVVLVFDIVWDATFTFVAIIIMTLILDEAGFFDYIAYKILGLGNRLGKASFFCFCLTL